MFEAEEGGGLDAWLFGAGGRCHQASCFSPRFGPRHLRAESILVRHFNPATGADPYHSLQVADIGDVNVNLYDLKDSCRRIREAFRGIVAGGCIPLTLGEPSRRRAGREGGLA